mgnify:CR=1 FL=1|tara:strand:- start:7379 stop:10096 length:2718 start_codon:yes stop_codon:yes gene_type:complete
MAEEKTTDNTTDKKDTTGLGQFDLDKIAGIDMSGRQAKEVNTKGIDEQITALEKPAGGSVYDKMAARYRSQGEGAVLRTQKNLTNLFGPTVNLIQEREAAAQARFTLLKDKLPEFDNTKIFGEGGVDKTPMPILAEIESISKTTKEDMRMLSRLNPNDERYDEIKKRIEKNQDAIVAFDEINQKLLEIRNSQDGREDFSQWSRGMDETTRQMWEDIYASKGENITIQDGKLVWTNTKTTTSYDFGDYKSSDYYFPGATSRMGMLIDLDTDYHTNDEFSEGNGGAALGFLHSISVTSGVKNKSDIESNGDWSEDVNIIQAMLNNLGYTDDEGKVLEEDGDWGDSTQEAYNKYLKDRDEREKAYLDENLTDEEKKEFVTTTGGGETRTIDLNEIGDGPTMIDNLGIEKDIEIQDGIQVLINSDIEVTDPRYDQKINQLVRTLNSVGPKGLKSLIFDGFGGAGDDVLTSVNTDSFIEQIIKNNPEEFGIKDIDNLTEEEIINAHDKMRSGDVTMSYNTGKKDEKGRPIKSTLQSQYLQWYRNEIDTKVREGKKSKLVATQQGTNTNTSNKSNRSNRSSKKKNKENKTSNFNEAIAVEDTRITTDKNGVELEEGVFLAPSKYEVYPGEYDVDRPESDYSTAKLKSDGKGGVLYLDPTDNKWKDPSDRWGNLTTETAPGGELYNAVYGTTDQFKSSIVLPTLTSTQDNKEISYENAELVFENGIPYIQLDSDNKQSFEGNPTGLINLLKQLYPDADRNTIRDYVNGQIDISKDKATNEATKISEDDKKDIEAVSNTSVDGRIDKLLLQGVDFGGREASDYLLSYGDDDFVVNSLNREYGELGFTFKYEDLGALDSDAFIVSHENKPNTTFTIKFDTMSDDIKNTKMLIGIMKAIYNNNYAAASKFYMGEL